MISWNKYRIIFAIPWNAFLLLFVFISFNSFAQYSQYPFEISGYPFVKYDSNQIKLYGDSQQFKKFYSKLDSVINFGKGQINIISIGGSHIQADIYTGEMRNRFQNLFGDQNAGRGLLFPYRLAHTNTPYGYYFDYTGNWETCRNVEKNKYCDLGLMGITATTSDSASSLTLLFEPENNLKYDFNGIRIYHRIDPLSFSIRIDSSIISRVVENKKEDYTEFYFNSYIDSLEVKFVKTDSLQSFFELYGMLPLTREPGICLHNIGINGAATSSFLRCNLMKEQLRSIKPDLVIFGLGINDAYGRNFNQEGYEANYDSLIEWISEASTDAAILLTTNNDNYLYKRYINRNSLLVQESMQRIAKKNEVAIWDMFEIMGGLNSIQLWKKAGLAKYDMVHFTREGYILLGDLLFDALIQNWGEYLQTGDLQTIKLHDELTKQ